MHSTHPAVLAVKAELDRGVFPATFESLVSALADDLREALAGVEICIAHNLTTMNKNLPLTAALEQVLRESSRPLIAWCHDLAATNPQYVAELHAGYPWDLLRQTWANTTYVTVSPPRQRELTDLLGLRADAVHVIEPGVDPARFFRWTPTTEMLANRLDLLNVGRILLVPARITRRKNLELALRVLAAIGYQTTIALQNAVLYRSLQEEKERIVAVEEEARKQLARDLHDGPTQSVAAIAMRMSYISKLLQKRPDEVPDELAKVEELARKTVREIRMMLFTLRPLVLESQGVGAALQQLATTMQETHGQAVSIRIAKDVESALDKQQQGVIFYIVEEAVNNARKHARAELISVSLGIQQDMLVCRIADNGVGFNLNAVNSNYEQRSSLGMVNMRERAAMLDGQLRIESAEGRGTTITIAFPLRGGRNLPVSNGKGGKATTKLAQVALQRMRQTSR